MSRALMTMRVDLAPGHGERRDGISQEWPAWLAPMGIDVFPVPNVGGDPRRYLDVVAPQLLILSGGNDVGGPAHTSKSSAPERDAAEHALIEAALERGCAILGVCRGLQLLNVHFGGCLSNVTACSDDPAIHVANHHMIQLTQPFSRMAGGDVIRVNSFHHYAVAQADLAEGLMPFAVTPDNRIIEGFVHEELPIVSIQWHPERPSPSSGFDRSLCRRLLGEGPFWRGMRS